MNWLAKIIAGNADEYSHAKLVKYGIGTHPGPRVVLSFSKSRITFKADLDYEKIFTRAYLKGAPAGSHKVKGIVRSYTDRIAEFGSLMMPLTWKRSKGKSASIFNAKVDEVAPLEHIQALVDTDDPTTFFLISLNPRDGAKPWKITTKTSFPKGGGGDDDEEKQKDPVFTKGALGNTPEVFNYVLTEVLPGLEDKVTAKTKKVTISNIIVIEDIVPPDNPNLSFSEKRKLAKKHGKFVRSIDVDGEIHTQESDFFI